MPTSSAAVETGRKKAYIFLTGAVVVRHCVVPVPAGSRIFDQPAAAKDSVLNKAGFLEHEWDVQRPPLGAAAEPLAISPREQIHSPG